MNAIATELNEILEGSIAGTLLSDLGRRMFFPKGIVAQSAEAKTKAYAYNATVGMATKGSGPLYLPSIYKHMPGLSTKEAFTYAPTAGDPELREAWKQAMIRKNPSLQGATISTPAVTSGLTQGILLTAELFLDKGESIVIPDMFWGNYRLIFEERRESSIVPFPFFSSEGGLNLEAMEGTLASLPGEKAALILNFPNNPTGYSPSEQEAENLSAMLYRLAEKGKKLLVITDDAYFGLFYEKETYKESLFARLANLHENILAVKVDGATKEEFVWGFRIGFVTYGAKGMSEQQYEALIKKTMGAIRSSVSNCSRPAQSLILQGLKSGSYQEEKNEAFDILQARYEKVRDVLARYADNDLLVPLPFNSGYFMAFTCKGDAEQLRLYLLDSYGIGAISIQGTYLRIAYSSVELDSLETLFETLFSAAGELWS
ncbi:MAG: aminotransferase class I/II-fold pyridoxal phosphate-dependent enzyme [Spirochaetota bacterium]